MVWSIAETPAVIWSPSIFETNDMNRRTFLKSTGLFLASAPYIIGQTNPAKYRTALIGCGWWGKNILKEAAASKRCQITALCDVDGDGLEVAADQVNGWNGDSPKTYKDHRELLE